MTRSTPRRLLLINPVNLIRKGFTNDPGTSFMPLGLGIVAALTPSDWEVELIDESFEKFTFRKADLVGLTGFTSNAPRAYEIAEVYRNQGIRTVMGGIHATLYSEEVAQYVDTVFTGEAEGAWPQLIADFESGQLKSRYDGGIVDIKRVPFVRRDIYKYPYVYDLVQTSRGCPVGCDFCSVTQMCGKTYRERDIDEILEEVEQTSRPLLFFVDDNFINNKKGAQERAILLFKGMIKRKIHKLWICQVAINFADNEEVLYWARKSGCVMVMLGVEAESASALKDVRKNLNLKRGVNSYEDIFRKAHKFGIGILAFMIFGMESDDREDLFARRDFILNSSIDSYQCAILTPLPGTTLFQRMLEQRRIIMTDFPKDWSNYDCQVATIDLPKMEHHEIDTVMQEIWLSLYHKQAMRRKMFRTLLQTRSFRTAYWAYSANHNYGRMFLEGIVNDYPTWNPQKFEWKNQKRSLYLKVTDKIIFLIYLFFWGKRVRQMNRR